MNKYFKILFLNSIFLFFLIEVFSFFLIKNLPITTRPVYKIQERHHYGDYNKSFGAWHLPNTKHIHKKSCFEVKYSFNSVGARDIERKLKSQNKNRTIVIGDSVVEGYGVSKDKRITNLLERKSNIDHLNFGTSGHYGTTQYYLNYKNLSSFYEHNKLIIFITLANDLEDDSYNFGKSYHKNRYRPYLLKNQNEEYEIIYFDKKFFKNSSSIKNEIKNFLNNYTNFYHILRYLNSAIKSKKIKKNKSEKIKNNINLKNNSTLYFPNEESIDILKNNIFKISEIAKKKDVIVYLVAIGHKDEFNEYFKSKKIYPTLLEHLEKISLENGITFIDAFTNLEIEKKNLGNHFFTCDSHHNIFGNRAIADYLFMNIYEKN